MTNKTNQSEEHGSLLSNRIFAEAITEIETLGFRIFDRPTSGAIPYGVVAGRSNNRWWLIPMNHRCLTTSGLALFQPVLTSALLLKKAAVAISSIGLSGIWARQKVYITKEDRLPNIFGERDLYCAFFTGTDSPHRKTAVQVMDRDGHIKGYIKISRNRKIAPMIVHEAETLNDLRTLDLHSAIVPKVLYCGEIGGAAVLATDSRKTSASKSVNSHDQRHIAFIRELAAKTADEDILGNNRPGAQLQRKYAEVAENVPVSWHDRLSAAIDSVVQSDGALGPAVLSHGDFTPWNTFIVDGKLYVFDWEYAERAYPAGYDLVHFLLSLPEVKRQPARRALRQVTKALRDTKFAADDVIARTLILCYLCGHSLRYITRSVKSVGHLTPWDGEGKIAEYLDEIRVTGQT